VIAASLYENGHISFVFLSLLSLTAAALKSP
jgi:hypothetical protein